MVQDSLLSHLWELFRVCGEIWLPLESPFSPEEFPTTTQRQTPTFPPSPPSSLPPQHLLHCLPFLGLPPLSVSASFWASEGVEGG